jgi:La-related protein 7
MLTRIRRNKSGWVPLSCIVKFNKMKKLSKGSVAVVAEALRAGSTAVEVNVSGTSCRRVAALPAHDPFEIGSRTVLVENLPGDSTAASLTKQFSVAGNVVVARLCSPSSTHAPSTLHAAAERDPWGSLNVVCAQQHALVEFQTRQEAQQAVSQLNDATNWRTGLRVRLVRKDMPHAPKQKGSIADEEDVDEDGVAAADGGSSETTDGAQVPPVPQKEKEDKQHGGKKKDKKDYASWASVAAHKQKQAAAHTSAAGAPPPDAEAPRTAPRRFFAPKSAPGSGPSSEPAAPGSGFREARMPDGTRGFVVGMGRGAAVLSYGSPRPPPAVSDEPHVE